MEKQYTTKAGSHNFNNEEIIKLTQDFYNKNHKIVLRDFISRNNLPSAVTMLKQFGSLKFLLEQAKIPISKENQHNFDRIKLSDTELLDRLKNESDKYFKKYGHLMTYDEIDNDINLQSSSTYLNRFGTLNEIYETIGYSISDISKVQRINFEQDMLFKYKQSCEKYNHTLNSREINKLHQKYPNEIYAMETYTNHFGNLHTVQQKCGYVPTILGKNITKDESIELLKQLAKELHHTPKQQDLIKYDYMPSCSYYINNFGTFKEALKMANLKSSKIYITNKGTKCNSAFEYKLALTLEKYSIAFEKEVMYSNVIPNFKRKYRFDFVIKIDNNKYYIELFGIKNNFKYNQRKQEKINICKNNNIPLIEFYQEDLFSKKESEIYQYINEYIKQFK